MRHAAAALAALALSACAAVPARPVASVDPFGGPRPTRELRRMSVGALPHLSLGPLVFGASMDAVVRGSVPGGAGDVLCGTGSGTAAWGTAASCGLSTGTNYWSLVSGAITAMSGYDVLATNGGTSTVPRRLGWTTWASGNYEQLKFGDDGTAIQAGYGQRLQILGYGGISLHGARGSSSLQAFEASGGTSDYALSIYTGGANALSIVSGNSNFAGGVRITGQTTSVGGLSVGNGANITSSTEVSFNNSAPPSQAPGNCQQAAITMSGIAAGAECSVGTPATGASTLFSWCSYNGTNTVELHICNVGTVNATASAGVYYCRCWNH